MESVFKILKKIEMKNYTTQTLCDYLSSSNISIVYFTLNEIRKEQIKNAEIKKELLAIAENKRAISSQGLGVSTLRIAAIAALKDLGDSTIYDALDNDEKNLVKGIFT